VSAAIVDLFTVYRPAMPADVGRLDVIGRQVGLDAAAHDVAAAADDLARMDAVWARLKPAIPSNPGAEVVAKFEKSLAAQKIALETENGTSVAGEV